MLFITKEATSVFNGEWLLSAFYPNTRNNKSVQPLSKPDNELLAMLKVDPLKPRDEETYTRDTSLIKNYLLERLNRIAALEGEDLRKN
ncbi:hypothetical protein [Paenibacillus algicola]|uniref:hypothetical protein n=1 Tax=Paenibacillus algicola TaxID=2565926 RepID=UPI001C2F833E|nr:hypothetical protein [Paenibacillus algicola]